MAYFNQFPVTYQPMMYAAGMQQNGQNAANPQQGIIWVQGEAAAKSYLVAPGSTVQLWDSEEKVIYLKSADASGMPSMKVLEYTIRGEETEKPAPEYATKEDLNALNEKIDKLRTDMAKRKTVRVIQEEAADDE